MSAMLCVVICGRFVLVGLDISEYMCEWVWSLRTRVSLSTSNLWMICVSCGHRHNVVCML